MKHGKQDGNWGYARYSFPTSRLPFRDAHDKDHRFGVVYNGWGGGGYLRL